MHTTADEFVAAWNAVAAASGWIQCKAMTKARQQALRLRMTDPFWVENWRDALARAAPVPGLRGQNDRGWRANVEWFLRPGTVVSIVEGKYDAWGPKAAPALAGVPSQEETARRIAAHDEYSRKALEEWEARGEMPKLARE